MLGCIILTNLEINLVYLSVHKAVFEGFCNTSSLVYSFSVSDGHIPLRPFGTGSTFLAEQHLFNFKCTQANLIDLYNSDLARRIPRSGTFYLNDYPIDRYRAPDRLKVCRYRPGFQQATRISARGVPVNALSKAKSTIVKVRIFPIL